MYLETIKLTHFKNYETANLTFHNQFNAFVGLNGVGKTNLLDAIYYMCMCKSAFFASDIDVVLRGSEFSRLEAVFSKNGKQEHIVAKVQPRKKKIFERNGVAYDALSEHIGFLPVVMIAPNDTELVKDGSEERRRFLDAALSQLDNQYLINLIFYNRIVEQRNATLKKWADTFHKSMNEPDNIEHLLAAYDHQMLPLAAYIFQKRQAFIRDFEPIFNEYYKKISDERETVNIIYESPLLTESLQTLLLKNREKDRILQRTSAGIHKDNLAFEMSGKPLRRFGSQGQLKSFVVALKLAQYDILRGVFAKENENSDGENTPDLQQNTPIFTDKDSILRGKQLVDRQKPILLLDDIFDKLDENRVHNLLQIIVNQGFGQIFITDTHIERIDKLSRDLGVEFKKFYVENGQITT